MRAKKYLSAVHDWLDAQDTRWVAPVCVVGELKKLKTENGSDADMILFFSYPCLIRAHPWLEIGSRKLATDSHGTSRMRVKKYICPVHGWLTARRLETTRLE
jgi:hypothetical protein